jgi:hypothetical protein
MTVTGAIETYYKGYRFRSRTEARWAIFFDTLGVKWEYEREGYTLSNGMRYLPDFWLDTVQMWAEVRPGTFTPEEKLKCKLLVEATGFECLMLDGTPDDIAYYGFATSSTSWAWDWMNNGTEDDIFETDFVLEERHMRPIYERRFYASSGTRDRREAWLYAGNGEPGQAVQAARSARFEFGETPR